MTAIMININMKLYLLVLALIVLCSICFTACYHILGWEGIGLAIIILILPILIDIYK